MIMRFFSAIFFALCWVTSSFAQDLEPRRWAQIPTGLNFAGIGYGNIQGDIFLDPVLLAQDVSFNLQNIGLFYMRSLGVMGKSARVDFSLPYRDGRWEGTVDGEPRNLRRSGFGDARMRFSMLLYGGVAETPKEFATSEKSNTVIGAAVSVTIPTGGYSAQRLINLGSNRLIIRPQLGITHAHGKWTGELTGSAFFYTDNNDFWQESELKTDPLFAMQAHLIYAFRPGLWASISSGYGRGAEATINGKAKNNSSENWLNAVSLGIPINRKQSVKMTFLSGKTQELTGSDVDSLILSYSIIF